MLVYQRVPSGKLTVGPWKSPIFRGNSSFNPDNWQGRTVNLLEGNRKKTIFHSFIGALSGKLQGCTRVSGLANCASKPLLNWNGRPRVSKAQLLAAMRFRQVVPKVPFRTIIPFFGPYISAIWQFQHHSLVVGQWWTLQNNRGHVRFYPDSTKKTLVFLLSIKSTASWSRMIKVPWFEVAYTYLICLRISSKIELVNCEF